MWVALYNENGTRGGVQGGPYDTLCKNIANFNLLKVVRQNKKSTMRQNNVYILQILSNIF